MAKVSTNKKNEIKSDNFSGDKFKSDINFPWPNNVYNLLPYKVYHKS